METIRVELQKPVWSSRPTCLKQNIIRKFRCNYLLRRYHLRQQLILQFGDAPLLLHLICSRSLIPNGLFSFERQLLLCFLYKRRGRYYRTYDSALLLIVREQAKGESPHRHHSLYRIDYNIILYRHTTCAIQTVSVTSRIPGKIVSSLRCDFYPIRI